MPNNNSKGKTTPDVQGANRPSDQDFNPDAFANEIAQMFESRAEAGSQHPADRQVELFDGEDQDPVYRQQPAPMNQQQQFGVVDYSNGGRQDQPQQNFQQDQQDQGEQDPNQDQQPQEEYVNPTAQMLNHMAAMMNQMQGGSTQQQGQQPYPQEQPQGQQPFYPQGQQQPDGRYLTDDDDIDAAAINKAINKALKNQGVSIPNDVIQKIEQNVIRSLAPVLSKFSQDQVGLYMMTNNFYTENPDLSKFRDLVQWRTNIVHSQNPGMPADQVLKQVAKEVRSYVGNPQQQAGKAPAGVQKSGKNVNFSRVPNQASFSGNARRPLQSNTGQKGNSLQTEIDALLNRRRY